MHETAFAERIAFKRHFSDNLNYCCRQGSFALHIGTKRNSISIKFTLYMKSVKIKAKSIIFSSL